MKRIHCRNGTDIVGNQHALALINLKALNVGVAADRVLIVPGNA